MAADEKRDFFLTHESEEEEEGSPHTYGTGEQASYVLSPPN